MAQYKPNETREAILKRIVQQNLYMGLFSNLPSALATAGAGLTFAALTKVVNLLGSPEQLLTSLDWTVPGNGTPATSPARTFVAYAGGNVQVTGYYLRDAANKLIVVETNVAVETTGVPVLLAASQAYRVTPQVGIS